MASPEEDLLQLAEIVAREASALGLSTAIIGALALAHHGYIRATSDVDFGTFTDFNLKLRPLAERLRALGLHVQANAPDDDDPLGGVLNVRAQPELEPVQLVNFAGSGKNPGRLAVLRAQPADDGLRYVRIPELVALKLFAGSRRDIDDAQRLLEANPDVDMDEIRSVCRETGVEAQLDGMMDALAR
jgi:hypothetical protein